MIEWTDDGNKCRMSLRKDAVSHAVQWGPGRGRSRADQVFFQSSNRFQNTRTAKLSAKLLHAAM